MFNMCFLFLLQGFVALFPWFVIEDDRFIDVWRADMALHSGMVVGHWLEPKQAKQIKTMSDNCNNTNSNLSKWELRGETILRVLMQNQKFFQKDFFAWSGNEREQRFFWQNDRYSLKTSYVSSVSMRAIEWCYTRQFSSANKSTWHYSNYQKKKLA